MIRIVIATPERGRGSADILNKRSKRPTGYRKITPSSMSRLRRVFDKMLVSAVEVKKWDEYGESVEILECL